ncbi:hypothetical protein DIS24_g770 [Lasiodiplodia hormozganensis]|uniref:DUF1772-domain-containing protein n=1 Tax=Lasiodiplodia hormozganensis TaxID=869390 RepID=A0AA40D670_9PEZI|nr:hypothetical protein DIS24_g770 [Lasiodiplodia hormozganensis]
MSPTIPQAVVGTTISFSYILLGNAITQSWMGVPALLVDFPHPSSPEHAARAQHLGRQWPTFWAVGNKFFRPISTLGIFGYAYTAWAASQGNGGLRGDWRLFAVSAVCHLVTVVHSAINMQPINEKLDGLGDPKSGRSDASQAEAYARTWIRRNSVRIAMPLVAGTVALFQALSG